MPVYRVQLTDGRIARIDATDEQSALQAATGVKSGTRGSTDYTAEKAKAAQRDKLRDIAPTNKGAFGAFNDAVGEPLPVGDEMRGGLMALGNSVANVGRRVTGKPTVDSEAIYLANKDAENEHRAKRTADHPVASTLGGLLSGFAAAPAKGVGIASSASGLLPRAKAVAKTAAAGGLLSSLYAGADSEGSDRAGAAANAFVPGAVLGGGLGVVGAAAGPILKPVGGALKDVARGMGLIKPPPAAAKAAKAVATLAASRGVTPQTVRASALRYGDKPVMAAELMGREGVTNLSALGRRSGETSDALEVALRHRAAGAPQRLIQDFTDSTGLAPATARGDVEAMVDKGRKAAAPLYEDAYAAGGIDSPKLATLVNRPSMRRAMSRALRIAAEEGRDPTELGFKLVHRGDGATPRAAAETSWPEGPGGRFQVTGSKVVHDPNLADVSVHVENPTAQTWDYVKRGLDDVLNGYRDPVSGKLRLDEEGRAILETLQNFRGEVTDLNPAYRKALEHSGDYLGTQESLNRAKGMLTTGTVRDFGRAWMAAKTPAAKEAFRAGIASDIQDLANSGLLKSGKLSIPGVQQKLELAFGKTGARQFLDKVGAEGDLARTGSRMMPGTGSATHELGQADADMGNVGDLSRITGKLFHGHPVAAAFDALGTGFGKAMAYSKTTGLPAEVRDEMGRILMLGPDDFEKFLAANKVNPKVTLSHFFPPAAMGSQLATSQARQ